MTTKPKRNVPPPPRARPSCVCWPPPATPREPTTCSSSSAPSGAPCTRRPRCCSRPTPNKAPPAASGSSPGPRWGSGTPSSSPSRCSNASRWHPATEAAFIDEQVDQLRVAAAQFEAAIGRRSRTIKDIEMRVLKLTERAKELLHRADKDDGATFEQLGCDYLIRRRGSPRQEPGHLDAAAGARQDRLRVRQPARHPPAVAAPPVRRQGGHPGDGHPDRQLAVGDVGDAALRRPRHPRAPPGSPTSTPGPPTSPPRSPGSSWPPKAPTTGSPPAWRSSATSPT